MTNQEEFDKAYITSTEVCKSLNITRATIVQGRRRGLLPEPIMVNGSQIAIWKRKEVEESIESWRKTLNAMRSRTQ